MRRRWWLLLLCLALAGGPGSAHEGHGAIALAGGKVEGDRVTLTPRARTAIGLDTVDVATATIERTLVVPAHLVVPAAARVAVASRVAGVVRRVHAVPGDRVAAGAVLAELDSPELAALAGKWASVDVAARYAEAEVARVRPVAGESVSLIDVLDLEAEARERRAQAEALAARFRRLAGHAPADANGGGPAGGVVLRSPRDGVVLHLDLVPGQGIAPETHLAEVADPAGAWIVAEVPEHRWGDVAPGQPARLHLAGAAAPMAATVDVVLPLAHRARHVVEVRARLAPGAERGGVQHGLRGSLTIVIGTDERAVLPPRAVARTGMDRIVFLVEREGVYRRTRVAAAPRRADGVEIRRGVYPGDTVVGHGAHQLAALFPPTSFKPDDAQLADAGVVLARVEPRPIADVLVVPGTLAVAADAHARCAPRLRGIVREVRVVEGAPVAAGDVLYTLESLAADALAAELRVAAARRDAVRTTVERLRPAAAGGATARRVLLAREARLDRALAEVQGLRGQLAAAGVDADVLDAIEAGAVDSPVLAVASPLAGVAAAVTASVGEVLASATPGVEVVDPARPWVEAVLHDRDLAALAGRDAAGLPARVHPPGGAPVAGRVRALRPEVRGHERVVLAIIEIQRDAALPPPGVTVRVALALAPGAPALAIPLAAIRRRGTVPEVFVRGPGGMVRVPVTLGPRDDRGVAVLAGLYPGDEVVVDGVEAVRTGILAVR